MAVPGVARRQREHPPRSIRPVRGPVARRPPQGATQS